jgi:hypothetical protein
MGKERKESIGLNELRKIMREGVEAIHDGRPRDDGSMLEALKKKHPEKDPEKIK